MKKNVTGVLLIAAPFAVADDAALIQERLGSQRMQEHQPLERVEAVSARSHTAAKTPQNTLSLTSAELLQQPQLLNSAMLTALTMNHGENVIFLLPLYQKLPQAEQDQAVLLWATAVAAKAKQDYPQAIRLYRELIASYPEQRPIRFQLALALFENRENEAAEIQFRKLQADRLPQEIIDVVSGYLHAIAQQDEWNFLGGITYLHEPNINNAPKAGTTYGNWKAPERESAQGIGFYLEADKKWSWGNGFFHEFRLNGSGKYYWDNKKYNEYLLRESLGFGYQNAKHKMSLLPFLEQVWYAGGNRQSESAKRYSKGGGLSTRWQYWIIPQWQSSLTYEYAEQRYPRRQHLNGNYHFVSPMLYFYPSSRQYWFVGVNFNRTSTRDLDDSFIRRGISAGWGQEWKNGLSTQLSANYNVKRYRAEMPIFQIIQRNKEYGVQASLWHRAVHFRGITPRLTWSYSKVKSNHVFYSYDKHRIYLEFSRTF